MSGNILKKSFPGATCQHCGKMTDIQMSSAYRNLVSQNKTLKEEVKARDMTMGRLRQMKNSQIQAMHGVVKRLVDLMTEEQKKEAKKINQFMRDELKNAEKVAFK